MPLHISHARIDEIKSVSYIFCHMFVDGITYKLYYMRIKTIHPHNFNPGKHLSLVFSMFLISILVWAQPKAKPIWILFDSTDSLCVKPLERTFDFYRIKTNTEQKLETFSAYDPTQDKIFSRIPRHMHLLNRKEILELLSKFPQGSFAKGLITYKDIYPVTYIVEKKGKYYIRYRVEKGDVFD